MDPTADAGEILRGLQLGALPEQVLKDGLVEVERRWTTPGAVGEEVLEVLAHCWGVLARVVAAGHQARGQTMDDLRLELPSLPVAPRCSRPIRAAAGHAWSPAGKPAPAAATSPPALPHELQVVPRSRGRVR